MSDILTVPLVLIGLAVEFIVTRAMLVRATGVKVGSGVVIASLVSFAGSYVLLMGIALSMTRLVHEILALAFMLAFLVNLLIQSYLAKWVVRTAKDGEVRKNVLMGLAFVQLLAVAVPVAVGFMLAMVALQSAGL